MSHATLWIILEDFMLSKIKQSQKDRYDMILLLCGISRSKIIRLGRYLSAKACAQHAQGPKSNPQHQHKAREVMESGVVAARVWGRGKCGIVW